MSGRRRWAALVMSGLQGVGPRLLVTQTVLNYVRHDMGTYAAAIAFSTILALFPFTIVLIGLVGALGRPEFFDWALAQAQLTLPSDAFGSLARVLDEVRGQDRSGLISIGIALALWVASAGVRSVMTALNAAYDVPESRPPWQVYPLSILYTIGLAVLIVAAAALLLTGPAAVRWLAGEVGGGGLLVAAWGWVRWPAGVLLLLLVTATVYYVAPDVKQPFVLVTPGSILTVAVWLGASFAFSAYVSAFGNFGATYGSLGGVIVLLLYFFISSSVLLLGAALNAVIYNYVTHRHVDEVELLAAGQPG